MKYKGVKTLEVLEGADNYNNWIASSLKKYIKSPALEIGAGTGNISSCFINLKELVLTDVDPDLVDFLSRKFKQNENIHTEVLDISKQLGVIKNKFKTIYSVNVLEHIKDDRKALRNIHSLLQEDGRVILLVPAKKRAYTKLDANLGHVKRYEKNELRRLLEECNFKVEHLEYFNSLGLLSWIVRSKLTRNNSHLKKSHVKMFDILVPILRRIEPSRGLPVGISLIAVGKRQRNQFS